MAGSPVRESRFPRKINTFGISRKVAAGRRHAALYAWFYPLLKLDSHIKFVQYIKLAVQEAGLGREWVRGPRLPISGSERENVLATIRTAFADRPRLPAV